MYFVKLTAMQKIAHKYRIYPNEEQAELLAKTFGCVRVVWNNILDWRSKEYTLNAAKINYFDSAKRLTNIKQLPEMAWLKEVSNVALQQALRSQDVAFSNFFAKRSNYPKFKSKNDKQSFRLTSNAFRVKGGQIFIAKSNDPLRMSKSRPFPDSLNSVTISKEKDGRYFISLQGESEKEKYPILTSSVGLDVGLTHFVSGSDGRKIENPKLYRNSERKLSMLQRSLSRKEKGGRNRNKARIKLARLHSDIKNRRADFLHKLSTNLIRENQTISVEDLNVAGMIKNRKLSKSISDASWSEFIRQLEYKSSWHGREFIKINRFYPSSQICSTCGEYGDKKSLNVREWECQKCGSMHDRDINAAININTAGLAEIGLTPKGCQI